MNSLIVHHAHAASIHYSLALSERPPGSETTVTRDYWREKQRGAVSTDASTLAEKLSQPAYDAALKASPALKIIFVHDPLDHLLDGLTEAHYLHSIESGGNAAPSKNATELARKIINALTSREEDQLHSLHSHFSFLYMETLPLLEWRPDFIGHVEHFNEDW